jgi:hypothetical protein
VVSKIRKRLTYANVMSTLAVFIALGGTSYAALTISGRAIKNRSIPGTKLKRNTLTGRHIKESRLSVVPRARNANRVGGLTARDLKVKCPNGTIPAAGVCVEITPRAASAYGSAVLICADAGRPAAPGRRLPTHGELRAALAALQLAPGGELTADVYPSSSSPGDVEALVVTDEVGGVVLTPNSDAGAKEFRCVTDPLN